MKIRGVIAAAAALAFAGSAMAVDEVFALGSHVLAGGETVSFDIQLDVNQTDSVIGFIIEWDYFEPLADASWASDAQAIVTSPLGANYTVGGFTNLGNADSPWSFDGAGSDGPGHYGDLDVFTPWAGAPEPKGLWIVSFGNDWAADPNPNEYNNLTITFIKTPAPGALALIGIAGLAGTRRRRI